MVNSYFKFIFSFTIFLIIKKRKYLLNFKIKAKEIFSDPVGVIKYFLKELKLKSLNAGKITISSIFFHRVKINVFKALK